MVGLRARWKHDVTVKDKIAGLVEIYGTSAVEYDALSRADTGNHRLDDRRIYGRRLVAGETEQHGAIGSVTETGESQRPVEFSLHAGNSMKEPIWLEFVREAESRAHWPHRMRTRRADTDFVQVE